MFYIPRPLGMMTNIWDINGRYILPSFYDDNNQLFQELFYQTKEKNISRIWNIMFSGDVVYTVVCGTINWRRVKRDM